MREHGRKCIGKIYNYYTVLDVEVRVSENKSKTSWAKAKCQCGNIKWVRMAALKAGSTKSCGCYAYQAAKIRVKEKSAQYKHGHNCGGKLSPTLSTWRSMIERCFNKKSGSFIRYGKKGLKLCDRWLDFNNFLNDMGERPTPKHTIDRIDNAKGYEPNNCRWATKSEQAVNRKTTRFYTINGQTKCLKHWAKDYNIKYLAVYKRIFYRKWDVITALTTPIGTKTPHCQSNIE